jgi:hypothetical protein
MHMRVVWLLLGVALLAACKPSRRKSVEYAQAIEMYAVLVAEKSDAAYADAQMGEVEGLLQRVTEGYVEHGAAVALLDRIQKERQRLVAEEKNREELIAAATKPVEFQHSATGGLTGPSKTSAPAESDAGFGPQPETGMSLKEFQRQFSGCFSIWQSIEVRGQGPMDAHELKDIANCRINYPGFVGKLILTRGEQVYSFIDKASVRVEKRLPDGGVIQDAGNGKP